MQYIHRSDHREEYKCQQISRNWKKAVEAVPTKLTRSFPFNNIKKCHYYERRKEKDKKKVVEVYNTEIIFSRVMYLLSAGQIDIGDLFSYELSPVPTSLFHDTGEGRYPTSKSVLKNELKVEESTRNINPDAVVIDGFAMLHAAVHWPKGGKVELEVMFPRK